jgi:hypothetical protein
VTTHLNLFRMYIDPTIPASSMKTEQDVNEATAALKGLLGLGVTPTPKPPRIIEPSNVKTTETPHVVPSETTPNNNNKKKRNNNNNKKKKNNENAQNEKELKSNKNVSGGDVSTTKKKRNSRKKAPKEATETYALSAFQSSPDASKLPIPEFATPVSERKVISPQENATLEVSSEHSAELEVNDYDTKTDSHKKGDLAEVVDADSSVEKEPEIESRNDAPVSTTGVNLAVLAAKPPQSDPLPSSPLLQPNLVPPSNFLNQPMHHPQHMPPQFPNNSPAPHLSPTHMPYSHIPHPGYASPPPLPSHSYHTPMSHHQYHPPYPPPPPPGYILISVQVPHALMPGRQMVVTTPAGYPVQVVVPDGIPAGAWMPVHVPANPPHMHPHPMMQQQLPPPGSRFDEMLDSSNNNNNNNQYTTPGH